MAEYYSSGITPLATDTIRVLEEKILRAVGTGGGGGGGGSIGLLSGAGDPSADPGVGVALYIDTNTGTLWQWYSSAWH